MDLLRLGQNLQHDAVVWVFVNVFMQQMGLPVPALPTLLLAGSLAAAPSALGQMLAAAVLASVVADWIWYHAGRRYGYRVLAGLCKLSINPASCVTVTEARFVRWGVLSLLVAKFIPGFSTVAPPIAGALRMPQWRFIVSAGAGGALWAGVALGAGWLMRDAVQALIAMLDQRLGLALGLALLLACAWLGYKLHQRHRFRQGAAISHVTPTELLALMNGHAAQHLRIIDLRGAVMVAGTGPLAGATSANAGNLLEVVRGWPQHEPIVTLCACPEDAGAVEAARRLLAAGYVDVRPLRGGYDAWIALTGAGTAGRPALTHEPR